ncbi:MAG TPA: hypothetical protein VK308_10385 [Pyrinomonadaceae bacterium]|nr:hypothetical protein [Pyrinomonadaceae bacterium]
MKNEDDLWGNVNMRDWRNTPCISGRIAVEEDVKAGRAVFYLQDAKEIGAKPLELELPSCAILFDEESNEELPIIVIQAEEAENSTYIGYRLINGGNGICTFAEVKLLSEPDERFF